MFHGFVKLNDKVSIAFAQGPKTGSIKPIMGVSHSGNAADPSAPADRGFRARFQRTR